MKRFSKLLLSIGLTFCVLVVVAQQPQIVFNSHEHDFGSFKESDGIQTTSFEFTNKGSVPLVINAVTASCGCTSPKWTKEPVPPGEKGSIEVSYNPSHRPGSFNKSVMVRSNASNGTTVLRITGQVEEREKTLAELYPRQIGALRAKTNHISFSHMKTHEVNSKDLELINDTDKPVQVGFRRIPNHVKAVVEPETIPAHGKGTLSVTYSASEANTYGFASHRIYLSLDGSNDYRASIGVSATIEEDFSALTPEQLANAPAAKFSESSHDFGNMKQGEKKEHTFMLSNDGKADLIIRNVRSSCGCTAVAPSKKVIAPGESAPVKVTFDSRGKRGRQSKSITVITNDPKSPTNVLRISCNVET
ncbi:MAG: DUF1573 domain-containing protein [Prolixibacteraceae bacterium]|nr:DUF1573 domain-containing protein [Prolixibacteraceae bacterium]